MFPKRIILYLLLISLVSSNCSKKDLINRPGSLDYKTLGTSARNFLSSEKFASLKIEIQYMPGYQLEPAAVANYTSFLNTYINKPGGISISQQQIAPSGKTTVTIDDVVSIEKSNRTVFTTGTEMTLHVLIVDANYSSATIVGISYWNTSMCLFGKMISQNSGGIGQVSRTKLESTVLEHETGHILGLVDEGSPMQVNHKDVSNGMHCNNSACLMYYAIETADFTGMAPGDIPLDANCVADLRANGGK